MISRAIQFNTELIFSGFFQFNEKQRNEKKVARGFFSVYIFLAISFLYFADFLKNNKYTLSLCYELTNQFYENHELIFFSSVIFGASWKMFNLLGASVSFM